MKERINLLTIPCSFLLFCSSTVCPLVRVVCAFVTLSIFPYACSCSSPSFHSLVPPSLHFYRLSIYSFIHPSFPLFLHNFLPSICFASIPIFLPSVHLFIHQSILPSVPPFSFPPYLRASIPPFLPSFHPFFGPSMLLSAAQIRLSLPLSIHPAFAPSVHPMHAFWTSLLAR